MNSKQGGGATVHSCNLRKKKKRQGEEEGKKEGRKEKEKNFFLKKRKEGGNGRSMELCSTIAMSSKLT
jgi:hypothetical protein